ncbi:Transposon Ty3-G Gag-Pol polyprotein [Araneus ventricosus]|uniref:Transposon Ty3-G Gag-Pol polyprotein n=1 Tax=Araneus ventricosus TaxID=182803 RepID=A0A4Y2N7R5_ARAVE|nr:Transposon Ty3-G Gag-Pol polyprotein [Araneus ventricosus]
MSSKYTEAIPVADINSVSVIDALLEVFSRMGFPPEIQCDNGTSFASHLTTEFFERFGIKVTHSSVHHSQSNPVERFHRTLKRLLKVLCLQSGEYWEKNLPATLLALRTVTHESTGFSPAELVHRKNLRTPEVLLYEHWVNPQESKSSVTEYVFELINRMRRCQDLAVERMTEVQVKRKACKRKETPEAESDELGIPYLTGDPNVYHFEEIIRDSALEERLSFSEIQEFPKLLGRHQKVFSNEPGKTHLVEHDIELISNNPIRSKPYRTSQHQTEILKADIKRMLDLKIIEIGQSDYTSPMILAEAVAREPRPCIDYRRLNSSIRNQYFPLPNIEERVERVSAAMFITVIDLAKGYWQIPLSKRAQRYAAFVTNFGTYVPLRMPFGLVNAPYFFSELKGAVEMTPTRIIGPPTTLINEAIFLPYHPSSEGKRLKSAVLGVKAKPADRPEPPG